MRLAKRVLVSALAIFVLSAVASAQRLRQENDPRNLSPAVGTGGPEGGPPGCLRSTTDKRFVVGSTRSVLLTAIMIVIPERRHRRSAGEL
jgi:hypothetical protein